MDKNVIDFQTGLTADELKALHHTSEQAAMSPTLEAATDHTLNQVAKLLGSVVKH